MSLPAELASIAAELNRAGWEIAAAKILTAIERLSVVSALEAEIAKLKSARALSAEASATLRDESLAHQARVDELEAENARLQVEMAAYRQKLTPEDVRAMQGVIEALYAEKLARRGERG